MPVVIPIKPKINVKAKCPKHLRREVQIGLTEFQKGYSHEERIIFDVVNLSNGDTTILARKIGIISFLKNKLTKEKYKPQYIIPKKESNDDIRPSFMVAFENAYHSYKMDEMLKRPLP